VEVKDNDSLKYLSFKYNTTMSDRLCIAELWSDAMINGLTSFSEMRGLYREFKALEKAYRGVWDAWITWTKMDRPDVMKILVKVGAQPYRINLDYYSIWFIKDL
jgi:hypothetical protein